MNPKYDIFKKRDTSVVWIEAAEDIVAAEFVVGKPSLCVLRIMVAERNRASLVTHVASVQPEPSPPIRAAGRA
jgi:hypothetical protein